VDRILEIVQRLADAPPPRQMLVELPQLEGLRIVVEAHGTSVVLQPVGADAAATHALEALAHDLAGALADRGLDLSGSWGREHARPHPDEPPSAAPSAPRRLDPPRRPEGLRL
jgi:hypothetical protein